MFVAVERKFINYGLFRRDFILDVLDYCAKGSFLEAFGLNIFYVQYFIGYKFTPLDKTEPTPSYALDFFRYVFAPKFTYNTSTNSFFKLC